MNNDLIMIRSLNFKRNCELDIQTYEDLHKDYSKRTKQSQLTDFYNNKTSFLL